MLAVIFTLVCNCVQTFATKSHCQQILVQEGDKIYFIFIYLYGK